MPFFHSLLYGFEDNSFERAGCFAYWNLVTSHYKTKLPNANGAYASGTVFLVAIQYAISTGKFKKYIEYNTKGQIVGSYLFNSDNMKESVNSLLGK